MSLPLNFSKLLSIEEYAELDHPVPYAYEVNVAGKQLQVFGADHSNDPTHHQYHQLRDMFTALAPHCVLLEGIQDELTFSRLHHLVDGFSFDEAIEQGGEAVCAAKLALEQGSTWQSIEPTDIDLFTYLEGLGFERREIMSWAVLRLLPQYIRRDETMHFAEYLEPFLRQLARATGWSEAHVVPLRLLEEAAGIIGQSIQLHQETRAIGYTSPLAVTHRDGDYTLLNTIAAVATEYRDRAMLRVIEEALWHYESILVVYGASHAVMQESVLRSLSGEE